MHIFSRKSPERLEATQNLNKVLKVTNVRLTNRDKKLLTDIVVCAEKGSSYGVKVGSFTSCALLGAGLGLRFAGCTGLLFGALSGSRGGVALVKHTDIVDLLGRLGGCLALLSTDREELPRDYRHNQENITLKLASLGGTFGGAIVALAFGPLIGASYKNDFPTILLATIFNVSISATLGSIFGILGNDPS